MDQRDPHTLVTKLAKALLPQAPPSDEARGTAATDGEATAADLAKASELPELVIFAGFLGDTITSPGDTITSPGAGKAWRLLYLDWRLQSWLLVKEGEIVLAMKIKDETAPCGVRDAIWVKAEASVRSGSGPQSVEARFLTGEFTRAGDYDAPVTGGMLAASTGIFCEARTIGCCGMKSRR